MQDVHVPGMLHGRVVRPVAIGAKQGVDDAPSGYSRRRPGCARRQFPRCRRRQRMGRHDGAKAIKATWSNRGRCPIRPSCSSMCAPPRSSRTRKTQDRQYRRGHEQGGREDHQSHLRLRHPHPRLDRPLLRDCRIQGRQADLLVGVAGDPQSAQAARADVRAAGRECALHLR